MNGSIPVAKTPVDSVAYYDSLANYNYQRFRANETMSDVFYWTSVGLSIATPILVFAARGAADCYGPEGCRAESVNLQVQISPLLNPLDGRYGAVLAFSF